MVKEVEAMNFIERFIWLLLVPFQFVLVCATAILIVVLAIPYWLITGKRVVLTPIGDFFMYAVEVLTRERNLSGVKQ
jgi:hypothetical protein